MAKYRQNQGDRYRLPGCQDGSRVQHDMSQRHAAGHRLSPGDTAASGMPFAASSCARARADGWHGIRGPRRMDQEHHNPKPGPPSGFDGEGPGSGRPAIDPLVIATSDPLVQAIVDELPEWRRHPEATLSVSTSRLARVVPPGSGVEHPGPAVAFPPVAGRPGSDGPPAQRFRPSRWVHAAARPGSTPWLPVAVVLAAMLGGVIGSAGYHHFSGDRRPRDGASGRRRRGRDR